MASSVFTVALALSLTHLTYADHIRSTTFRHHHRRQSVPTELPGNWTSLGCYVDQGGSRTLDGATYASATNMTTGACIAFCDARNFIYAGTEYSQECYCDNNIRNNADNAPASECNMGCSGNTLESCGGGGRLNVYWSGAEPPPPPQTLPQVGNWTSLGCYSDGVDGQRTLPVGMGVDGPNTIEKCTSACFTAGYQFSGSEFSVECFCGSAIIGGQPTPIEQCNMVCAGDTSQFCGGPNRLNLYNYTGTDLPPITTPGGGGGGGGGGAPVFPVLDGLPGTWTYSGCWVDNAFGRIFEVELGAFPDNTVDSCVAACDSRGYSLAGVEYAEECFCGNRLVNGAETAPEGQCNMGCAGNATQACGGPGRISLYSSSGDFAVLPVPVPLNSSLPGEWVYQGCWTDTNDGRPLPWQIISIEDNSVEKCLNQCAAYGYTAATLEYGQECYCGDEEELEGNGNVQVDEDECTFQCPGDPLHICGGGQRMTTYTWNGIVNEWHTPENIGRYEFLVPGVVVPLIATLGINNKVTFLEKAGTSVFENSTGAYELDLTLVNDFPRAYREMHVKSDVFCAASIILPDKAGRQINVGGWSLESTKGVRLYSPDGTDGVNGTNDWEEDYEVLRLQEQRWYPTAAVLANGSILVIGGEFGSNDIATPNLEILPKPEGGSTVVHLEWLARTDPWNLYPYVVVLPGGGIFVAYYNEARILDPVTFDTVRELPDIPGAVDTDLGGRTYPLEGSMVLFPQHAPYTDPLRVLLCGGSTGPGPAFVLDNCVSIEPEAENPTWTLERMPSKRVMSCMVGLPDGTMMIVNGAHEGVAGFGLAGSPNLNAVLYDPYQPVGHRFSILNNTIVPRMYHSEATLLPDGSVLISGSDPQTPGFDEEMRIEVYIPPYLNEGRTPPTFDISDTDWAYGGDYTITNVNLPQGDAIRISLVHATSSTHGNTMGARTIFPAFTCAGTTCTITAPPDANISPPGWHQLFILDGPTPSHSRWVRIGGDPGELGNWPDFPGFTLPGV